MSDTPSLGQRWVAACRRAGVEPWGIANASCAQRCTLLQWRHGYH